MDNPRTPQSEARLAGKHIAVSGLGFGVDVALLQLCLHLGMEPAWARVVSLTLAMQITFVVNGLLVFSCLRWDRRIAHQWASYMLANGFGNFCNYWIFVTLVSLHWHVVSAPLFAVTAASGVAWILNYSCTRFLVFGRHGQALAAWICRRWDWACRRPSPIAAVIRRPVDPSPLSPE